MNKCVCGRYHDVCSLIIRNNYICKYTGLIIKNIKG